MKDGISARRRQVFGEEARRRAKYSESRLCLWKLIEGVM